MTNFEKLTCLLDRYDSLACYIDEPKRDLICELVTELITPLEAAAKKAEESYQKGTSLSNIDKLQFLLDKYDDSLSNCIDESDKYIICEQVKELVTELEACTEKAYEKYQKSSS